MKIIFLGTNGWYTSETGNTPCILIDAKDQYVVFDVGNGIYKLDKYITEEKPVSLFISHFHLDHVSGVHTLPKFQFKQGLDIFVAKGRIKDFETLTNPPFAVGIHPSSQNILNFKMEVRLHELSEGTQTTPSSLPISAIELHHGYRNNGFRVTVEGKTVAYSGDCGISEKSKELALNADVLVHECSLKLPPPPDDKWGHVDPTQAATLAKNSGVKKLILTHFGPNDYPTLESRKFAEDKAKEIFPETIIAQDDLVVEI